MKRRFWAILLAAALALILLPTAAFAAGDVTVSINGTSYTAVDLDTAIRVSQVPLANITSLVFTGGEVEAEDWRYITSEPVNPPNDYTPKLPSLTTLTVEAGVTPVANLPNYFMIEAQLEQANMANVTSIGWSAFEKCTALTTASFPNAESIGWSAFESCTALAAADFPKATSIGNGAFQGCVNLASASFPNAASIGEGAFQYCMALTTASFPVAKSIDWWAFRGCVKLKTASFPAAESIGRGAFGGCSALATASFPAATSIGDEAFDGCSQLASLSLPAAPPTVNNANAFNRCPATRSLALVDASGAALTGQALNDAIDAYETDGGYSGGLWYGWKLPERIVSGIIDPTANKTVSVAVGSTATMTVTAVNASGYQWRVNRGGASWEVLPGATGPSYTTSPVTLANDGYQYYCQVFGIGAVIESRVFTLRVTEQPVIPSAGDGASPFLWLGLALTAMAGLAAGGTLLRRKRKN